MNKPFPWSVDTLAQTTLGIARNHIFENPTLPHHLAKAAAERWFAFELAYELDNLLIDKGWVTLVERGATNNVVHGGHSSLGNIDLLIVPKETGTFCDARLEVSVAWPKNAVAIEVKAAHLGDSDRHGETLVPDLQRKPAVAEEVGHPCAVWLGLLLSTSGVWPAPEHETRERLFRKRAREQGKRMDAGELRAVEPLVRLGEPVGRSVEYLQWRGKVWLEAYRIPVT